MIGTSRPDWGGSWQCRKNGGGMGNCVGEKLVETQCVIWYNMRSANGNAVCSPLMAAAAAKQRTAHVTPQPKPALPVSLPLCGRQARMGLLLWYNHKAIHVDGEIFAFKGYRREKMGKIIAVANQKGGVGKTTTAVNLTAALGARGYRTLLVDVDPQGNSTSGLGINKRSLACSTYELLVSTAGAEQALQHTPFQNVDVLPSNISLAGAEIELVELDNRAMRLKTALLRIRDQYDFILIDCPPSLGIITLNAFAAANSLLIPIQCEYYALEGLSQLIATLRQVKRLYNPDIDIEGVLLTMYDSRLNLTVQVVAELKKYFPQKIYHTVIPRNVRLSEAPSFGQPVLYYDRSSKGSAAYEELAEEFLKKNRIKRGN